MSKIAITTASLYSEKHLNRHNHIFKRWKSTHRDSFRNRAVWLLCQYCSFSWDIIDNPICYKNTWNLHLSSKNCTLNSNQVISNMCGVSPIEWTNENYLMNWSSGNRIDFLLADLQLEQVVHLPFLLADPISFQFQIFDYYLYL